MEGLGEVTEDVDKSSEVSIDNGRRSGLSTQQNENETEDKA
jgi:hypothetical protein